MGRLHCFTIVGLLSLNRNVFLDNGSQSFGLEHSSFETELYIMYRYFSHIWPWNGNILMPHLDIVMCGLNSVINMVNRYDRTCFHDHMDKDMEKLSDPISI